MERQRRQITVDLLQYQTRARPYNPHITTEGAHSNGSNLGTH